LRCLLQFRLWSKKLYVVCAVSGRVYYSKVFELYHKCPSVQFLKELGDRDFCEAILIAFGLDQDDYQLGVSKVGMVA